MDDEAFKAWYGCDREDAKEFVLQKLAVDAIDTVMYLDKSSMADKETEMKQLLYVLKNYKQAYAALMSMYSLEGVIEGYKTKTKKGPTYLYGRIGQATVEVVGIFNETEEQG